MCHGHIIDSSDLVRATSAWKREEGSRRNFVKGITRTLQELEVGGYFTKEGIVDMNLTSDSFQVNCGQDSRYAIQNCSVSRPNTMQEFQGTSLSFFVSSFHVRYASHCCLVAKILLLPPLPIVGAHSIPPTLHGQSPLPSCQRGGSADHAKMTQHIKLELKLKCRGCLMGSFLVMIHG